MIDSAFLLALLLGTLRFATPLWFAAMGGLFSERSGLAQIGLEAYLLTGAFFGAAVAYTTHSAEFGFFAGGIGGMLMAALFGLFAIYLRSDHIMTGVGINIFAMGLMPLLGKKIFNSTGSTPSLDIAVRFVSGPVWFSLGVVVFSIYVLQFTTFGIRTTLAGEKPEVLESAGVSVNGQRWMNILVCGLFSGFGGASLSLFLSSQYSPMMSGGRGFMALAALILGKWKPVPTFFAVLLFAFFDALQIRLQGMITFVPLQVVQILPYILTILLVAGVFGKSKAPSSIGRT